LDLHNIFNIFLEGKDIHYRNLPFLRVPDSAAKLKLVEVLYCRIFWAFQQQVACYII